MAVNVCVLVGVSVAVREGVNVDVEVGVAVLVKDGVKVGVAVGRHSAPEPAPGI